MDGANLLQLTKTRLNNLKRRGTSLKQLCSQYVEINFGIISYSSVTLPFELRNDLLERLCKQQRRDQESLDVKLFEERKKFFEHLLNKYTKKLDLSGILSFCPKDMLLESLTQMIRAIAENAPNIEELTIGSFTDNSKSCAYYRNEVEDDWVTSPSETLENELSRLSKLKSLKLATWLIFRKFIRLASLCSSLPDLQVLYARVKQRGEVLISDAYLDSCFPSLICYYIVVPKTEKPLFQPFNHLKEICSSNTEALKSWYISKTRISSSENTLYSLFTGSPGRFCQVLMEIDNSGRYEENMIQSVDDLADKYFVDDFKFMNEAMVHASTASLESIPVSSFRYVCFTNEDYSNVLAQLENIGKELHTLMIESSDGQFFTIEHIRWARTFELCPKLKKIIFHNIITFLGNEGSLEPFHRLRELQFDWVYCTNGSSTMTKILSAPSLEKLALNVEVSSFKAGGLKQLASSITDGLILRKLQSLEIRLRFTIWAFPEFDILELGELLKAASAHLPYLSDFRCFICVLETTKPCIVVKIGKKEQENKFVPSKNSIVTSILALFKKYKLNEYFSLY